MADSVLTTGQQIGSIWALGGLTWRELLRRVWSGVNRNDLFNRAYELAYNFLLAVFPMLLFLVGLLGMLASEGSKLRLDLFYYFQLALPPAAYDLLVKTLLEVTPNSAGGKLTFGLLFALYSGSSGMTQLMSTLNAAYEVKECRSWIKVHLISLGLTLAMSVLVIAALFLVLAGGQVVASLGRALGLNAAVYMAVKILQWALALAFVIVAFAMIYSFAPNVHEQHWYWITPGSVVGGCDVGLCLCRVARIPAFFQHLHQDLWVIGSSDDPDVVVLRDGLGILDWEPDQRNDRTCGRRTRACRS